MLQYNLDSLHFVKEACLLLHKLGCCSVWPTMTIPRAITRVIDNDVVVPDYGATLIQQH